MALGDVFILLAVLTPVLFVAMSLLDIYFSKHFRKCPYCGASSANVPIAELTRWKK